MSGIESNIRRHLLVLQLLAGFLLFIEVVCKQVDNIRRSAVLVGEAFSQSLDQEVFHPSELIMFSFTLALSSQKYLFIFRSEPNRVDVGFISV